MISRMLSETVPISFPGLGIDQMNPPDGFSVFGFEIKFYGVLIALGVLLAVLYAMRRSKQFGLTSDDVLNIIIIGLPFAILGARAYYIAFYPGTPWSDFFKIRNGGLAIYGGVLGAVAALLVYFLSSKKRRGKLLPSFDLCGIGLLIGQSIGRWGNFFNREAYGAQTNCFLRMGLLGETYPGEWSYWHPTFLYESVWNLVGLVLLHFLSKKRRFDGQVFVYYLAWYGLGRVWIEGLRTDSLWWGGFRVSQVLAGATFAAAALLLIYMCIFRKPDRANLYVNRSLSEETSAENNISEE